MIGGKTMTGNKKNEQKFELKPFGVGDEIELFIEEGWDDPMQRKSPKSRMPGGRIVIFRREHHNYMKIGETWLCRIDEDRVNVVVVTPLRRLSASPITQENDKRKVKKMPPEVATVIIDTLEVRIRHLQQRMDTIKTQTSPLEEKKTALTSELQAIERDLSALKDEESQVTTDLEMFHKSINTFKGMEAPDDVSIEEIEQESGLYGIPDYWQTLTNEGKDKNDDRQIGKPRQEGQE